MTKLPCKRERPSDSPSGIRLWVCTAFAPRSGRSNNFFLSGLVLFRSALSASSVSLSVCLSFSLSLTHSLKRMGTHMHNVTSNKAVYTALVAPSKPNE